MGVGDHQVPSGARRGAVPGVARLVPYRRPTVRDIAIASGVSRSVASRALTGSGYVSDDARRRVLRAAAELDYVPHATAKHLKERVSRSIGVLVGDLRSPFDSGVTAGVSAAAHVGGFTTMLADLAGATDVRRALEHFVAFGVAGVVVTAPAPEPVHVLRRHDVPVVEVDHRLAARASDGVVRDHEAAARTATGLLLDRGHGPVALVLTDDVRADQWAKGYRAVVGPDEVVVRPDAVGRLVRDRAVGGLVLTTEQVAAGLLAALHDVGARVPEDVGLVCLDEAPWMSLWPPGLMTVTHPADAVGRAAVERLLDRFAAGPGPARTVVLAPTTRVRGSVRLPV